MPSSAKNNQGSPEKRALQRKQSLMKANSKGDVKGSDLETARSEGHTTAPLPEVDREWFNIQIRDLEGKLSRAHEERNKLNAEVTTSNDMLEKTVQDSNDVIRYLQKTLSQREDECQEFKERLHGLQLARQQEAKAYEERLSCAKIDYDNMVQQLTSEIKLLEGKLTSLEEFRLESEEMTEQLNQLKVSLKEKEQQLPLQLERMERQMLLEIQKIKDNQKDEIAQLAKDLEKQAFEKLNLASKNALEENTVLLRQVALLGSKLTTAESQLASLRYQNQGYKALIDKSEIKCTNISKQLAMDKQKSQMLSQVQSLLLSKTDKCKELETSQLRLKAVCSTLQQTLKTVEKEHSKCVKKINGLTESLSEANRTEYDTRKQCIELTQQMQTAKKLIATFLAADKEDPDALNEVMHFLNDQCNL